MWRLFHPTFWDWLLLFGPLGFFAFLFLCFVRLVPAVLDVRGPRALPPRRGCA